MSIYAACMLTPVAIMLYVATGGLTATFLSSYMHTVIIFVVLVLMASRVYLASHGPLGSLDVVYDRLTLLAKYRPLSGNRHGSYLTMFSMDGLWFGLIGCEELPPCISLSQPMGRSHFTLSIVR